MPSTPMQRSSVAARLLGRLNLRFPGVFMFLVLVTLIDFVVPDLVPFVDEIGLALLTILLGSWKNRRATPSIDGGSGT